MTNPGRWRWLIVLGAAVAPAAAQVSVTIDAQSAAKAVPSGFAGCSIEMSGAPAWAGLYTPSAPTQFDWALVNFLNLLGQYEGPPLIRVGGNSQDRTWLSYGDNAAIPPFNYVAPPTPNALKTTQVNGLAWVQRYTGCPFTMGLNMGGELPPEAVTQMQDFAAVFAPGGIAAFDVGNEPDESDFTSYRPSGWSEKTYTTDLVNFLAVLRAAKPDAIFAGPAVGGTGWLPSSATTNFNTLIAATKGQLSFVTAHRYIANGSAPPADPIGSLYSAANSSNIAANYTATLSALKSTGLPLRMNETNTFYNGGLAGVSNAMASSLWIADVLGSYATAGIVGVNFHGAASGPYTPFTMTSAPSGISVAANPVYYGMLIFAEFIQNGGGLVAVTPSGTLPASASLYACRDSAGALRVLVINKDRANPLTVNLGFANLGSAYAASGSLSLLLAPNINATAGLSLGGLSYDGNGQPAGASTAQTLPGNGGSFAVTVPSGSIGLFTLERATAAAPTAAIQASAASVLPGGTVIWDGQATGTAPFAYQWLHNGAPIGGATNRRFVLPAAQAGDAGTYSLQVANPAGMVTSGSLPLAVAVRPTRLLNLSTRAQVASSAAPLTVGFVIGGTQAMTVLVRAAGPSLTSFGVAAYLPQPVLTLFDSHGWQAASNAGWSTASNASDIAVAAAGAYAFPFAAGSGDSALLVTLPPGNYTAQVTSASGVPGVTLVEVYEADAAAFDARLLNVSTSGLAGTGAAALTGGFVVNGPNPEKVLIRGVGPGLQSFGVKGTLSSVVLTVNGPNGVVAANHGWDTQGQGAAISAAEANVQAFPLAAGSGDSALVLTLAPGNYSAVLSSPDGSTGTAMVEVYEAP